MAVFGNFYLKDYTIENGLWKLHFENPTPGPGMPTDYYLEVLESEVPANISQNNLKNALKTRLGYKLNQTYGPLNTLIASGDPVVLP